jgi:hypothetical protein
MQHLPELGMIKILLSDILVLLNTDHIVVAMNVPTQDDQEILWLGPSLIIVLSLAVVASRPAPVKIACQRPITARSARLRRNVVKKGGESWLATKGFGKFPKPELIKYTYR